MKLIARNRLVVTLATLSILLQFCLLAGSDRNTRVPNRVKLSKNRSGHLSENSTRIRKPNDSDSGRNARRTKKQLMCHSVSCASLEFLDNRLQHLKSKLLNYYHKKSRALATSRGDGIGFPSLEGALLSLAFLTFAVFLIDLIQQLMSRLRVGAAGGGGNAGMMMMGRRRRSSFPLPYLRDIDTTTVISSVVSSVENPTFVLRQT